MKTNIILAAASAISILLACQKTENPTPDVNTTTNSNVTISGVLEERTKVDFCRDENKLVPAWAVGDQVIGFKSDNSTCTLAVESIDGNTGVAKFSILSGSFQDGDVWHCVYAPNCNAGQFKDGKLYVDFTNQGASDGNIPALMTATGTLENNYMELKFKNQVAIVSVSNWSGVTGDVKEIVLSGHDIISNATVSLSGNNLVTTAGRPQNFITKTVSSTVSESDPVCVAVPVGSKIAKITLVVDKDNTYEYSLGDKTTNEVKCYNISGKTFSKVTLPVTKVKVGKISWSFENLALTDSGKKKFKTTDQPDHWYNIGDFFQWGDNKVKYTSFTTSKFLAADGKFIKNLDTFSLFSNGEFNFSKVPYYVSSETYSKYNSEDGLTELEPVDDIVMLTFPGSGWRMTTKNDFEDLIEATKEVKMSNAYRAFYVEYNKKNIVFPCTGGVKPGGDPASCTFHANYWTSTLGSSYPNGWRAQFKMKDDKETDVLQLDLRSSTSRAYGLCVRPVRTED